ncbi:UNKNOWN [Stylonychia lemnae]|uniref:Uncharacterized protein n=1 Tax=Stylonychia lemnae TaxID=5949 RepID=A0A078AFL6_STYLE|nr:UNKNOWN [Stylonychia lemnae]|eukprot:CDW79708.1 UNKNOWN [Stylonychia lemnae]
MQQQNNTQQTKPLNQQTTATISQDQKLSTSQTSTQSSQQIQMGQNVGKSQLSQDYPQFTEQSFTTPAKNQSQNLLNQSTNSKVQDSAVSQGRQKETEEFKQKQVQYDGDTLFILKKYQINTNESQDKILKSVCRLTLINNQLLTQKEQQNQQLLNKIDENQLIIQKQNDQIVKLQSLQAKEEKQKSFNSQLKLTLDQLKNEFTGFDREVKQYLKAGHNNLLNDFNNFKNTLKNRENQKLSFNEQEFLKYREEYK